MSWRRKPCGSAGLRQAESRASHSRNHEKPFSSFRPVPDWRIIRCVAVADRERSRKPRSNSRSACPFLILSVAGCANGCGRAYGAVRLRDAPYTLIPSGCHLRRYFVGLRLIRAERRSGGAPPGGCLTMGFTRLIVPAVCWHRPPRRSHLAVRPDFLRVLTAEREKPVRFHGEGGKLP